MSTPNFSRSNALNNISSKKIQDTIDSIKESSDDFSTKSIKIIAVNRYVESNIPVEYWSLKMERDFKGDPRLLSKYNEYIADLKNSYMTGNSICFAGNHGLGKQLSLDTELPTPSGFIKLSDLKEGDQLFDEQGNICNVTKLHPINISPESYEIIFDDGNKIEACADHLWSVWDRKNRKNKTSGKSEVLSTKNLITKLKVGGKQSISNYSIQCSKPINYSYKELPIDPYLFGLWLGDGDIYNANIETADLEILEKYPHKIILSSIRDNSKSVSVKIFGLRNKLKLLKLVKKKKSDIVLEKFIPNEYLISSYEQRLSLLQGLLDTDGCCNKNGGIEFSTIYPKLAEQVCLLIKSLGIKTKININESWLYDKRHKDRYRITFTTKLPVFKLKRKLCNLRLNKSQLSKTEHRFIVSINRIISKPMRCITVDSASHLFLVTRSFIPTHNTLTISSILKKASEKNYTCLYTTLSDIVNVLTQAGSEDKFLARKELSLVDFLAIDEFDSRFMPNENAADLYARTLENVFRTRSQNKMPTLMATNSPNAVESFHGSLKTSIDSLMHGYVKIFSVAPGLDFRKKA